MDRSRSSHYRGAWGCERQLVRLRRSARVAQPAAAQVFEVFEGDLGLPADPALATHLFLQPGNGKPEALRRLRIGLSESTDPSAQFLAGYVVGNTHRPSSRAPL